MPGIDECSNGAIDGGSFGNAAIQRSIGKCSDGGGVDTIPTIPDE
jgi:hypothetical protein